MIISFAWTSDVFADGLKSVTRRKWKRAYALKFKKGTVIHGYDKNPRAGGKFIGYAVVIKDAYEQPLSEMSDNHFHREGGTECWTNKDAFIEAMGGPDEVYWVIEFKRVRGEDVPGWVRILEKS